MHAVLVDMQIAGRSFFILFCRCELSQHFWCVRVCVFRSLKMTSSFFFLMNLINHFTLFCFLNQVIFSASTLVPQKTKVTCSPCKTLRMMTHQPSSISPTWPPSRLPEAPATSLISSTPQETCFSWTSPYRKRRHRTPKKQLQFPLVVQDFRLVRVVLGSSRRPAAVLDGAPTAWCGVWMNAGWQSWFQPIRWEKRGGRGCCHIC